MGGKHPKVETFFTKVSPKNKHKYVTIQETSTASTVATINDTVPSYLDEILFIGNKKTVIIISGVPE